jgi:hypothetical protein
MTICVCWAEPAACSALDITAEIQEALRQDSLTVLEALIITGELSKS